MIRRSLTALAAGLLLASSAHATVLSPFQNGDFGNTNVTPGTALYSGFNTAMVTAPGWTFGTGTGVINHSNAWTTVGATGTVAFLQSYVGDGLNWTSPTISQTFSTSGNIDISFQLAQRFGNSESVNVTFDGAALGATLTPAGSDFTTYTFSLSNLALGSHTLSFKGINRSDLTDSTVFIDNVSVSARAAVPEPASAALMLTGLGLLGVVSRRRKQRKAA